MKKQKTTTSEKSGASKATPRAFRVTRKFTGGTLKGLEHTEVTCVPFVVGFVCKKPCYGGDPYVITKVEEVQ